MPSVVGHNDYLIVFVDNLRVSMRIFTVFVLKLIKMLGHLDFHRIASRIIGMVVYYHTYHLVASHLTVPYSVRFAPIIDILPALKREAFSSNFP